jgi:hypothetical protein
VKHVILKVERCGLPGFEVQEEKIDFRKSWGKVDFFLFRREKKTAHG